MNAGWHQTFVTFRTDDSYLRGAEAKLTHHTQLGKMPISSPRGMRFAAMHLLHLGFQIAGQWSQMPS